MQRLPVFGAVVATALSSLCAQTPLSQTLFKDINPGASPIVRSSSPQLLGESGGLVYLAMTDGHGVEPWVSDGTEAGTFMLADLNEGTESSWPRDAVVLPSGRVVFRADSAGANGEELYVAGPGISGAQLLKDINPGPADSFPSSMVVWNGEVWFLADDGVSGVELWRSDGTTAGTQLAEEVVPGASPGFIPSDQIIPGDNVLYFIAWYPTRQLRIKTSSAAPSTQVTTIGSYIIGGEYYATLGDDLIFNQRTAAEGVEPWRTDGTPGGTALLLDINPGPADSDPVFELVEPNRVWFDATTPAAGTELWVSDGSTLGTTLVKDIKPGTASAWPNYFISSSLGVFFSADDGVNGSELWTSDGTPGGTFMVADIYPGSLGSIPQNFFELNGAVYFQAFEPVFGGELWTTDGTEPGTMRVLDLNPQTGWASPVPLGMTSNGFLISASDRATGSEPWLTDGTALGTQQVINAYLDQVTAGSLGITELTYSVEYLGRRYFQATTEADGTELWETDGTVAGTRMVLDFLPGPTSSYPQLLGVVRGGLLVSPRPLPATVDNELFLYVPETGTTQSLKYFPGGLRIEPVTVGDTVYFAADDGTGQVLWKSDGTVGGTVPVPGSPQHPPFGRLYANGVLGDYFYYRASDPVNGAELWRSNGVGSELVADLEPGAAGSNPSPLMSAGGKLYFTARVGNTGTELWSTDGTAGGTQALGDLRPGIASSTPGGLTELGDLLLFWADDGTPGAEFWTSDGTAAGTNLLIDIQNGQQFNNVGGITVAGGVAFLSGPDGSSGFGIWTTDGTPGNTVLAAGGFSTAPRIVDLGDGHVAFNATNASGGELWVSDGTQSGTYQLADTWVGPESSGAADPIRVGTQLLFTADDGVNGRELHGVALTEFGGWVAEPYGRGCGAEMSGVGQARLNQTLGLAVQSAGLGAPAALYFGVGPAYLTLAQGCDFNLAGAIFVAVTATNASGVAQIDVPFPNDPSITGIPLYFEYVVAVPGGPFAGVAELSDGLEVIVGS